QAKRKAYQKTVMKRVKEKSVIIITLSLLLGLSLLILSVTLVRPPVGNTASGPLVSTQEREQVDDEKDRREDRQREFEREHSDRSGRVRPDLLRQGIEHFKRMETATGISSTGR